MRNYRGMAELSGGERISSICLAVLTHTDTIPVFDRRWTDRPRELLAEFVACRCGTKTGEHWAVSPLYVLLLRKTVQLSNACHQNQIPATFILDARRQTAAAQLPGYPQAAYNWCCCPGAAAERDADSISSRIRLQRLVGRGRCKQALRRQSLIDAQTSCCFVRLSATSNLCIVDLPAYRNRPTIMLVLIILNF